MTWDRDLCIEQTLVCAWCNECINEPVAREWRGMHYHLTCYSMMVHENTVGEEEARECEE